MKIAVKIFICSAFWVAIVNLPGCRNRVPDSTVKSVNNSTDPINFVAFCRDFAQGDVAKECLLLNRDFRASSSESVWVKTFRNEKLFEDAKSVVSDWLQDGLVTYPSAAYRNADRDNKATEYDVKDKDGKMTNDFEEAFTIHQRGDLEGKFWTRTSYVYPPTALLANKVYCHRDNEQQEICLNFEKESVEGQRKGEEVTILPTGVTKRQIVFYLGYFSLQVRPKEGGDLDNFTVSPDGRALTSTNDHRVWTSRSAIPRGEGTFNCEGLSKVRLGAYYSPILGEVDRKLLIFGSGPSSGAIYDPASGSWEKMPGTPLELRGVVGAIIARQLMVVGQDARKRSNEIANLAYRYDFDSKQWLPLGLPKYLENLGIAAAVAADKELVLFYRNGSNQPAWVAFDTHSGSWGLEHVAPGIPTDERMSVAAVKNKFYFHSSGLVKTDKQTNSSFELIKYAGVYSRSLTSIGDYIVRYGGASSAPGVSSTYSAGDVIDAESGVTLFSFDLKPDRVNPGIGIVGNRLIIWSGQRASRGYGSWSDFFGLTDFIVYNLGTRQLECKTSSF